MNLEDTQPQNLQPSNASQIHRLQKVVYRFNISGAKNGILVLPYSTKL